MRDKYILERYPEWMLFGRHVETNYPFITDVYDRIEVAVNQEDATRLVEEHNRVIDALVRTAIAFSKTNNEAFVRFWYGTELDHLEKEKP